VPHTLRAGVAVFLPVPITPHRGADIDVSHKWLGALNCLGYYRTCGYFLGQLREDIAKEAIIFATIV
jgi:hypothetical protein